MGTVISDLIACGFEELPLTGRQVLHLAGEHLVASAELGKPPQPNLLVAHVLHVLVVELGHDGRVGPLEPLACDQQTILAKTVFEQIRTARAGRLSELLQEAGRRVAPVR